MPRPLNRHGTLTVAGCPLHYDLRGDGPPVIMLHGVGIHGSGSDPQTIPLSSRYSCLSFDNRGIGRSVPRGEPVSVDRMARDTLALMDALGWPSAHIVGHSLGGLVAQHLALTARARVKSLALLCTFSRGKDATKMSARTLWIALRILLGTRRSRRHAYLEIVMPPAVLAAADPDRMAEEIGRVIGHDLADQPPITLQQLKALRTCDVTARLRELAGIPTLVVSADRDPIAPPPIGQALAAAIPGAKFVLIENAAHGVTMQYAERMTSLLAEHFAAAEGRPASEAARDFGHLAG